VFNHANVQEVVFDSGDITISGTLTIPAGKKITFKGNGAVTGAGTISGGIVGADRNSFIFKGTLAANFVTTTTGEVSAKWWGALGNNSQDEQPFLQRAIDCCVLNRYPILRMPAGIYRLNKGVIVFGGANNVQVSIAILGDEVGYADAAKTTQIKLNSNAIFGIGIHLGKGCKIAHIQFEGANTLYSYNTLEQIFDPSSTFITGGARNNRYSPHSAVVFDPFHYLVLANDRYAGFDAQYDAVISNGGSTDCSVENCSFANFVVSIIISPNSGGQYQATGNVGTQNAECLIFDRLWFSLCKVAVATCQSQSRTNICTNIKIWSAVQTCFDSINYGLGNGDMPIVDNLNIAGGVYQVVLGTNAWGDGKFTHIFAEVIYRIGDVFGGAKPVVFDRCNFDFAVGYYPLDGLMRTPNAGVSFNGCTLRYYDDSFEWKPMNFNVNANAASGQVVFRDCFLNNPCATGTDTDIHRGDMFSYDNCYFYHNQTYSSSGKTFPNFLSAYSAYAQEGDIFTYPLSSFYQHQRDYAVRKSVRRIWNSNSSAYYGLSDNFVYNPTTKKITFNIPTINGTPDLYYFVGQPVLSRTWGIIGQVESIVGQVVTLKNCPPVPSGTQQIDYALPQMMGRSFVGTIPSVWSNIITDIAVEGGGNTSQLQVNMPVFGDGVWYGARIKSIDSPTQVTLSRPAPISGRILFAPWVYEESFYATGEDINSAHAFSSLPAIGKGTIVKRGVGLPDLVCTVPGIVSSPTPSQRPVFEELVKTNKDSFTLTTDGTRAAIINRAISKIYIKPSSSLTSFKIGFAIGGDEVATEQPVPSGGWTTIYVDRYRDTATTLYFAGISSSTDIIIFYE
jgi:hypothetical protein